MSAKERSVVVGSGLFGLFAVLTLIDAGSTAEGVQGVRDALPDGHPVESSEITRMIVEWMRIAGAVIGMIVGGLGLWAYYRTMVNRKTNEAQAKTIEVYQGEIAAHKSRADRLHNDLETALRTMNQRDAEVIALRARTDLSQVLEALRHTNEAAAAHDKAVMDGLSSFVKQSEQRYTEGMGVMNKLLSTLGESSQASLRQAQQNHELLVAISGSIAQLTRRINRVQATVEDVHSTVESQHDSKEGDAG